MQTISSAMVSALAPKGAGTVSRNRTLVFEVYDSEYFPDSLGRFDPADALELWARVGVTWLSHDYNRRIISFTPPTRYMTSQWNNCSMVLSNADLYVSNFVLNSEIDGMRLVIRYVDLDYSTTLDDSVVIFVGRLQSPSEIDHAEARIDALQELATLDMEVPKRRFSPQDPDGRSPNDPLYEGINFHADHGSFPYLSVVTKRTFFGLLSHREVQVKNRQWTAESATTPDQVLPLIFGLCQMELLIPYWADVGFFIAALCVGAGHKVTSFSDVTVQSTNFLTDNRTQKFTSAYVAAHLHLGDPGGTGTNAAPEHLDGSLPLNSALLSRVAYLGLKPFGPESPVASSPNNSEDPVPTITSLIRGEADLPDGSGVFNQKGFTDSPAYLTRFILTTSDVFGLDARLINDSDILATHAECFGIIRDESNGELLFLTTPDAQAVAAGELTRYNSSSALTPTYWRWAANGANPNPYITPRLDAVAVPIDPGDCPPGTHPDPNTGLCVPDTPTPMLAPSQSFLRRRWVFNAPLTAPVQASSFLFDTVFPAAGLYMLVGPNGQLRVKIRKPADSSFLYAGALAGATSIKINDVEPWRTSLQGYVLIGVDLATSETRKITSANYTTDSNGIPVSVAADSATISVDHATLSGGSPSVTASALVTISAIGSVGDSISVTIDGRVVIYDVASSDSVASVAGLLAASIAADWHLRTYIRTVWHNDGTFTIYSKLGVLNFATGLANNHSAEVPPPTMAPTISAVSGGTLPAGTYTMGFTFESSGGGETLLGPLAQVTVSGSQRISVGDIGSLPAGVGAVNLYVSKAAGDDQLALSISYFGAAIFVNTLPVLDAQMPPVDDTSGEETIRVMAVFTQQNVIDGKFKWPLPQQNNTSAINQISITFHDAVNGFAERTLVLNDRAHQRRIRKTNKKEIDGSGVNNFSQAWRLMQQALAFERDTPFMAEWATDEAGLPLEEGDVVAVNDSTGGFVNLPLTIEVWALQDDLSVVFTGRRYSTASMSDNAGRRPVVIPTTLKYLNQPPPIAINLVLSRTASGALQGDFDFGKFPSVQHAFVYLQRTTTPADADFHRVENVLPDGGSQVPKAVTSITRSGAVATATVPNHGYLTGRSIIITGADQAEYNGTFSITATGTNTFTFPVSGTPATPATGTILATPFSDHGIFEIPGLADGQYNVKVVTQSGFGKTATSGHPTASIFIQPRSITDILTILDAYGDRLFRWTGHPYPIEVPEDYAVEIWSAVPGSLGATIIRTLPVANDTDHRVQLIKPHEYTIT